MNNFHSTKIFLSEDIEEESKEAKNNLKEILLTTISNNLNDIKKAKYIEIPGHLIHPALDNNIFYITKRNVEIPKHKNKKEIKIPLLGLITPFIKKISNEIEENNLEESVSSVILTIVNKILDLMFRTISLTMKIALKQSYTMTRPGDFKLTTYSILKHVKIIKK